MQYSIFWMRRDLRLEDNAGFYHALRNSTVPVQPIFIFDANILDKLQRRDDPRVQFIHDQLVLLNKQLKELGSSIRVYHGDPVQAWTNILSEFNVTAVFTNRDYEPYAKQRDEAILTLLKQKDITFHTSKDHVLFESHEVLKADGKPYTVFTPYKRKWFDKLGQRPNDEQISYFFKSYPSEDYLHNLAKSNFKVPELSAIGFEKSDLEIPSKTVSQKLIKEYDKKRNFPAIEGTSRLGIHFRFGTISIREKARKAYHLNRTFLNELIWRDFYSQILDHFPRVVEHSFRPKYDQIEWRNDEEEFERWKLGTTGYPIVDAGMRQLSQTGYMHNRVRMITASFLTKHLLIDWRWGEHHFAEYLLDFDLASNNGGWQWAAGSGTDAAPYFRVFNPTLQQEKFDKHFNYVKKFVPEFGTDNYPSPVVDHKFARERCLDTYKKALNQ